MGMDIVEINLCIEEEFNIDLTNDRWEAMLSQHSLRRGWIFQYECGDATVSELCHAVNKMLADEGMPVPRDTFERVQAILVEVLGVRPEQVQPKTFLMQGLGMD